MRLEKLPMELLILLVQHRGELVSRDAIAQRLWGKDVFVDIDHSINTAIRKIRLALRDDPEKPRFVETVVGRGYRFAAPVTHGNIASVPEPQFAEPSPEVVSSPAGARAREEWVISVRPALTLVAIGVAVLVLIVIGVFVLRQQHTKEEATQTRIRSLAVLPLKNLSGDPSQEYLADGMTEAIIGRLSRIHDLRVNSRTSVMPFKDSRLSLPEIAKTLGADALMEGSVVREGNRIRVHAQLIRAATDEHFWSETYDRELPDVLSLQSDVAQAVAQKVEATVSSAERQRLAATHAVAPAAFESYLKGQFALRNKGNSAAGIEESIRLFEDALDKDPAFASTYVGLAKAHARLGTVMIGGPPDKERAAVVKAARRALELDPDLAEAHVMLADVAEKQWHWTEAEAEYNRALELDPNDVEAHAGLARWLLCQGRIDEALSRAQRAQERDRLGSTTWDVAWILFNARRYDDAIRETHSLLAVHPDDMASMWLVGFTLIMKGEPGAAIPVLEKAAAISDRTSGTLDVLAAAYARAGRRADALRLVKELHRRKEAGYVPAASLVIAYVGLGDNERAFTWLEHAYQERSNLLQFVKVHPFLDPLRGDSRFRDLVHRVGLD